MQQSSPVSVRHDGDIAWVVVDNPPVNATSLAVRQGLRDAVALVAGAKLAVLVCEGKTFIAGGDMSEFDAAPVAPHLPDVVQMIEDSATPFLALMHGNVLGGGFEIAMGCAWRIAAAGTRFGLPEVNVGLIPGAGGTQRLPRLIGLLPAIDVACSGRLLKAEDLLRMGGLDAVEAGDLQLAARAFAEALPVRPVPLRLRPVAAVEEAAIEAKRGDIARKSKGQKSPLLNLEALLWSALPFKEAQAKERALHLALRGSEQSRALRHVFFAERAVVKPAAIAGATPRDVRHVAVVGGGLMGAGIAVATLGAGCQVTLIERDADAVSAAQQRVVSLLEGALRRGKISAAKMSAQLAEFRASDDYADAGSAGLAIEAVFEDVAVKRAVFERLAGVMRADAILATNTSYLDPGLIFAGIANPGRCLGLHFFSPAHIMKLLEVVALPGTDADVLATGFAFGKRLRKVPVLSGICDGFIGNRMLAAYRREADCLLAEGALPYQVDGAMRAFGMAMGPYELQDLTGLQIAWANRKRQQKTDHDAAYNSIADQLCEAGRLGQRSGGGWYAYDAGSRTPRREAAVEQIILEYSASQGIARRNFTPEQISQRILLVLAREGAAIVAEGIAERAADVDVVQVHGYGFPRWRGGPMHYAASATGGGATLITTATAITAAVRGTGDTAEAGPVKRQVPTTEHNNSPTAGATAGLTVGRTPGATAGPTPGPTPGETPGPSRGTTGGQKSGLASVPSADPTPSQKAGPSADPKRGAAAGRLVRQRTGQPARQRATRLARRSKMRTVKKFTTRWPGDT
ncbi:3-hydroxyacyl-CoA dehydrogenase NAD-binding domain-containing protein [Candidatus Halocynthiibacter alkanivorans]|uniref:3-hydroxyacyl-CoA dehydrogenase NAD-binding domain-containing protein n=1 Tax=Candidatus Halocynthiibacter alkanivorans TaxID=2267619 RepID=UPI000DF2A0A6